MDGLEALEEVILTFDCGGYQPVTLGCVDGTFREVFSVEFPIIKNELQVNRILREKNVNLQFISHKISCEYSAQEILEEYNAFSVLTDLTLEEMTLIVEWKKRKRELEDK